MKTLFAILLLLCTPYFAEAQFGRILDKARDRVGLGEDEVAAGLKEALEKGVTAGTEALSIEDGYYKSIYKILLPEEAQSVVTRLSSVPGFQNLEADLVERINRAAELAAGRAKPIFSNAIRSMSIRDATDILMGEDDAATRYLHRTTFDQLYLEFLPVIRESLEEVNAVDLWERAATAYNRLPMVSRVETRLDEHVTNRGLDGLFSMVEKEEYKIRTDVSARTSDLLRRVFSRQDDR
ncbi:MAG: DUF4197 domain-containing protein [Saprospirales bacterium]|nr:MAG: DUF4197 domain-containing protein [Saprospirales bacterium]